MTATQYLTLAVKAARAAEAATRNGDNAEANRWWAVVDRWQNLYDNATQED